MSTKIKFFCLLLAGFYNTFSQPVSGDTWANASVAKTGDIFFSYVETPGFVYKDKSGNLTGICVDIMKDFVTWVKTNRGVDLRYRFVGDGAAFQKMYAQTKSSSGGVFGLGNITITEDRKKEVKFSPPFITNFAILVTQPHVPTLQKMEDLASVFAGMTAYAARGTVNEKRTLELKQKYFPNMQIVTTTTSQETLEKVFADPKGFAYLDLAFYIEAVQLKKNIKRHAVADKAAERFGIIMPSSSDWSPMVEEFFNANGGYTSLPAYKNILLKHLGEAGTKFLQASIR